MLRSNGRRSRCNLSAEVNVVSHVENRRRITRQNGFVQSELRPEIASRRETTRIAIKAKRKILFVDVAEIVAIEARGNNVVLRHQSGSHVFRQSISEVAEKLRDFGFVRIHRSFIVNSAFAKEIEALPTGDYLLRVCGGNEYTVTRTYKENLPLFAASWLGINSCLTRNGARS